MNIFVLIKQVPNTTKVKLDKKTGNLIREGVEAIINPEDRHAVEAAVRIKEAVVAGGGQAPVITAVSMGPPQAIDILSEAYAMGADKGVLLSDRLFAGSDTWATSTVLAAALDHLAGENKADMLVLAGRQAIDGDTAQIGPQVAEALGLNQATYVESVEPDGDSVRVVRDLGGDKQQMELKLPALLTVLASVAAPRQPHFGRLLHGCTPAGPFRVLNAADIGLKADETGLDGSLTHVVKTFSPKQARQMELLEGSPADMARTLVTRLTGAKVLLGG